MVILSPRALPDIRLNVDEYLQADLPEGQRYELVEGAVEMSPTPDLDHDDALNALYQAFYEYRRAHPTSFMRITQGSAVPIPGQASVREPDLALYDTDRGRGGGWSAWKEILPLLVVEVVSPGQASRDYQEKRREYWLAGIREYWIVDPQDQRVTVLARGEQDWREQVYAVGQDACSAALPGFSVPVARLCP